MLTSTPVSVCARADRSAMSPTMSTFQSIQVVSKSHSEYTRPDADPLDHVARVDQLGRAKLPAIGKDTLDGTSPSLNCSARCPDTPFEEVRQDWDRDVGFSPLNLWMSSVQMIRSGRGRQDGPALLLAGHGHWVLPRAGAAYTTRF